MLTFNLGRKTTSLATEDAVDTHPVEVDQTGVDPGSESRATPPMKVDGD